MNIALVMMGGSGTRFGGDIPKQFVEVDGKPIFTYLLEDYESFDEVDLIYIACHKEWKAFTKKWVDKLAISKCADIVEGGDSRSGSIRNALLLMKNRVASEDVVLIHDVTHPFLDKANVGKCIEQAREKGASTLVGSCLDTMYQIKEDGSVDEVLNRNLVVSATSPECFTFGRIFPLYEGKTPEELAAMTSAGAMMVSNGEPLACVKTPLLNLKITYHEDMQAFVKLVHGYYYE